MEPVEIDVRVVSADGREWSFRATAAEKQSDEAPKQKPRRLAWNLFLIVLIGLAISLLLALYTEAFSAFAAALGLGGIFVWIAFLKSVVSEDRKAELQEWFESEVLTSKATPFALLAVLAVLFTFLVGQGVIVLHSVGDSEVRAVTISRLSDGKRVVVKDTVLAPGSTKKILLWALPGRTYRVEVNGLPFVPVRLSALQRETIHSPTTFIGRPLTLIRVAPDLANTAGFRLEAEVFRGAKSLGIERHSLPKFQGRPLWVGCGASVPVPDHVKRIWRAEWKLQTQADDFPEAWELTPGALFLNQSLEPRDRLVVRLFNANGTKIEEQEVKLQGGEYQRGSFKEILFK
jgi:hypothetical protein